MMTAAVQNSSMMRAQLARHDRAVGERSAEDITARLRAAGVRPTRQRVALGLLLFGKGDRHVTAEVLFEEAQRSRVLVSLATVYNCLHIFAEKKMIRELNLNSTTTYYDTDTRQHCHFVSQVDGSVRDVPDADMRLGPISGVPDGLYVVDVQVVVKLRPKGETGSTTAL